MSNAIDQKRQAAIRQLIAVRAYEMWENQGRPHGHDVLHWHQAEQEVLSCLGEGLTASGSASAAPSDTAKPKRASA